MLMLVKKTFKKVLLNWLLINQLNQLKHKISYL